MMFKIKQIHKRQSQTDESSMDMSLNHLQTAQLKATMFYSTADSKK